MISVIGYHIWCYAMYCTGYPKVGDERTVSNEDCDLR